MFGGKKLKDLTEEDIRKYAASLACASAASAELPPAEELPEAPRPAGTMLTNEEGVQDTRKLAETISAKHGVGPNDPEYDRDDRGPPARSVADIDKQMLQEEKQLELDMRRLAEQEEQSRRYAEADQAEQPQNEEEALRAQVLAELDRSQMPALVKEDGRVQKTVEHYTFADSSEVATISIELDKDLFEGAAAVFREDMVEVKTKETDVTIWLHGVPVSAAAGASLADWRLYLSPLFHSVDPEGTTWKVRKGKVSVRLKKRKPKEWKKILKF